jgi:hypothetical protein
VPAVVFSAPDPPRRVAGTSCPSDSGRITRRAAPWPTRPGGFRRLWRLSVALGLAGSSSSAAALGATLHVQISIAETTVGISSVAGTLTAGRLAAALGDLDLVELAIVGEESAGSL